METRGIYRSRSLMLLLGVICGLYLTRFYSSQLFESVAGIFSIVVACGIFMVAWNSRSIFDNGYFQFLGVAFLFVAGFDLLHTFAFPGSGMFPGADQNLPQQLWLAARYLQASALLIAPLLLGRRLKIHLVFLCYGAFFLLVLGSIFLWGMFPISYRPAEGFTAFARVSEVVIVLMLAGSLFLLVRQRRHFEEGIFALLVLSTTFALLSGAAFALHGSPTDILNLLGHLCKTISFYVFHNAIIDAGFINPYNLLVMHLRQSETELILANEELESRVRERVAELDQTNSALRGEITERRSAEEEKRKLQMQLLQAQKLDSLGKLAGGVAHDFNNLISAVLGFSELAMESLDKEQPEWEYVQIINSVGERAAALTNQLLAFSRRQVLEMRVVNLNAIVEDMGKMLRRIIGEDIELTFTSRLPLRNVLADVNQLEQILLNLSINARDAMPAGGKLAIATSETELDEEYCARHEAVKPGRYILLSVTDSGEGMSREILDRIFEPFFTTKEQGKGTGLGLATVYGIVRQHNGHIEVVSEPGRGATFQVYIPAVDDEMPVEAGLVGIMPRGTETIMVVDDEPYIRRLVEATMAPLGYTIIEASNGQEALQISTICRDNIHLLLTDIVMPGMNGTQLAKLLSAVRTDMKVVYMSGYTDDAITHRGLLEAGAIFIRKPLSPHRLANRIREALDWNPADHAVPFVSRSSGGALLNDGA